MILSVVAMFDKKARAFAQPFFVAHTDVAVRTFKQAANTPDHQVCLHAEDFSLFYLGTFDDTNGAFNLTATPSPLVEAIQLKRGSEPQPPAVVTPISEPMQSYRRN